MRRLKEVSIPMAKFSSVTRRGFLKQTAGAAAAPVIVPGAALGLGGAVPPSDRITLAGIGMGQRNRNNLRKFLEEKDVQVVANCDCFADRRELSKQMVDKEYGNTDCASYRFHEEVLDRSDIDAVLIGTGDRWHALMSMLAARAGKDVYCEKPFSMTIGEGRALVETTKRYGTIWQCGTQRKSNPGYKFLVDVVQSGRVGKVHTVTTSFGPDAGWLATARPKPQPAPDPNVFDYDRWLGPAPWAPYAEDRVRLWRLNWDTGAGAIADMGAHYLETAQWALGDQFTGPTEFEGEGVFRDDGGLSNIPYFYQVRARYPDGVRLYMDSNTKGLRISGDKGWIRLSDLGGITATPDSVLEGLELPNAHWQIQTPHIRNFLDSMRSRELTASHPEISQRVHSIVHCGNLALRLGRKLRWDPKAERFENDAEANCMLHRTMRAPWRV